MSRYQVTHNRSIASILGVAAAFMVAVLIVMLCRPASAGADPSELPVGASFRECADCPEMVVLPAGEFLMGSSDADIERDVAAAGLLFTRFFARSGIEAEAPQHRVRFGDKFAVGKYPVTASQFREFFQQAHYQMATGCDVSSLERIRSDANWLNPMLQQSDQDPVVCVNWSDAKAYVQWLNKKILVGIDDSGKGPYRLLSEAEWEYAARAGTTTARWWGNDIGQNNAACEGCGSAWDGKRTAPVGSFRPNQFGLYDMLGNVFQVTDDCWHNNFDGAPADGSAWLSGRCDERVIRGGAFATPPSPVRSAARGHWDPAVTRTSDSGFRVARTFSNALPPR